MVIRMAGLLICGLLTGVMLVIFFMSDDLRFLIGVAANLFLALYIGESLIRYHYDDRDGKR